MNSQREPIRDDELEAYLDGTLDADRREPWERQFGSDPSTMEAIAMQRRIDDSLCRAYAPPPIPVSLDVDAISRQEAAAHKTPTIQQHATIDPRRARYLRRTLWIAAAASLAWFLVVWQLWRPNEEPVFVVRALADIYQETVNAGFQPYYDCSEEARFADAFQRRQGQPLRLAELPPGRQMLGLSYPGGLSRDTTAMLCEVDDQPVMVFIDRTENDKCMGAQPPPPGLHIHRGELGPLVLYEVSPWDTPHVLDSLQLIP